MAGRPRLVHVGSPITDETEDDTQQASSSWLNERSALQNHQRHQSLGSLARHANSNSTAKNNRKPYKLQTRLVIGDVTHEDDEEMKDEHADATHAVPANYTTSSYQQHHESSHFLNAFQHQQNSGSFEPSQTHLRHHTPPIIDHNLPPTSPLVVIDGANIAYNYAESLDPSSSLQVSSNNQSRFHKREPNPRGIRLAIEYFLNRQCRVQAVVPTSWFRLRPRFKNEGDAKMVTDEVDELRSLREQGFLVACPPGDDDDSYAIALARREDDRKNNTAKTTHDEGNFMMVDDEDDGHIPDSLLGGYLVSNDFFHDAVRREEQARKDHKQLYSTKGSSLSGRQSSLRTWLNQKRISYSFANVGKMLQGQAEMEFLPNPRQCLVEYIEARHRFGNDL